MKNLLLNIPLILGIILLLFVGLSRVLGVFDKGEETIITSSTLVDAIDISELSTSQFIYNGIAEMFTDEEKKERLCYVRYNAKVKAGIDMKKVEFDVDEENKTVRPILPEIEIKSNTVDEKALSFLPEKVTVELKDVLVCCEEDVEHEAMESQELLDTAEENLQSIIQALIEPIIVPQGYRIIWDEA